MFELDVKKEFSAAHNLRGYQGNCAEKHGHNWGVQVKVRSAALNSVGIAVDFKLLKKELELILEELDHKDLNSLPPFETVNPTSENLAKYIFKKLKEKFNSANTFVYSVRVSESSTSGATYFEE